MPRAATKTAAAAKKTAAPEQPPTPRAAKSPREKVADQLAKAKDTAGKLTTKVEKLTEEIRERQTRREELVAELRIAAWEVTTFMSHPLLREDYDPTEEPSTAALSGDEGYGGEVQDPEAVVHAEEETAQVAEQIPGQQAIDDEPDVVPGNEPQDEGGSGPMDDHWRADVANEDPDDVYIPEAESVQAPQDTHVDLTGAKTPTSPSGDPFDF